MTGEEKFFSGEKELPFNMQDFWKQKYSNVWNMQEYIAEFLVERALGVEKSQNADYWTLWDITYRGKRIEVKETSYYHPWNVQSKISTRRSFSIRKANSAYENALEENKYARQNDVYIFCVNTGETKVTSDPLQLDNWIFYIVPTEKINKICKEQKTISLGRVEKIADKVEYADIRKHIDMYIEKGEI